MQNYEKLSENKEQSFDGTNVEHGFDKNSLDKFDHLMGDTELLADNLNDGKDTTLSKASAEDKFSDLFDKDDYKTDDHGTVYKKNGELLADTVYTERNQTYHTDDKGRIVKCEGNPRCTEEGIRNNKAQKDSGGDERQEEDDGGHIIAKVLGGAEGLENLVPMRSTINRGDYKKMENEISKGLQEGKEAIMHVDLDYEGASQRPYKITVDYTIDDKKAVVVFDNNEASTALIDVLSGSICEDDYVALKSEIGEMKADGIDVAITSVKTDYDENCNPTKVTVGLRDESIGEKSYKVFEPQREAAL